VAVHLLLLATSEAAQPRSRSARPPQSRSAEPCIAKDGESSSWHDSSSSSSWWSNSRAHTRFNRVRLRKDFDNAGPHEADTLPMRGGQLKANNAAVFKTKFQVTQNRRFVLVFFVLWTSSVHSGQTPPSQPSSALQAGTKATPRPINCRYGSIFSPHNGLVVRTNKISAMQQRTKARSDTQASAGEDKFTS
jgi:hypothetical protein